MAGGFRVGNIFNYWFLFAKPPLITEEQDAAEVRKASKFSL